MSFWKEKTLEQMTPEEWEALCDGCARCCMIKLEDEDSGEVHYTSLVCDLLDTSRCRCTKYPVRHQLVPDCIEFSAHLAATLGWLPTTCAYRRLAEGLDLPDWHPLVSGSQDSVHQAGISVRGKVIPVRLVDPQEQEEHIINWVES